MANARDLWYERFSNALRDGHGETIIVMDDGTAKAVSIATSELMNGHRPVWVYQATGTPAAATNGDRFAWIAREAANALPAYLIRPTVHVNILAQEQHSILALVDSLVRWVPRTATVVASADDTLIRRVAALAIGTTEKADIKVEYIPPRLGDHLPNTLNALTSSGRVVLVEHAVRLTRHILEVDGLFVVRRKRNELEIFRTKEGALVHASGP